jgi:hypothetical protein
MEPGQKWFRRRTVIPILQRDSFTSPFVVITPRHEDYLTAWVNYGDAINEEKKKGIGRSGTGKQSNKMKDEKKKEILGFPFPF